MARVLPLTQCLPDYERVPLLHRLTKIAQM